MSQTDYMLLTKTLDSLDKEQKVEIITYLVKSLCNNADFEKPLKQEKTSCFGQLKNKITFISPDFDNPIEDFAEYM